MALLINVPFEDKDKCKQRGGMWDPKIKSWYIPDSLDSKDFQEWLPTHYSIIVRDSFYIVESDRDCWKCGKKTPLIALAIDWFWTSDDEDEEGNPEWNFVEELVLLSQIEFIPKPILSIIQQQFPFFQYIYSNTTQSKSWANQCVHCNALQGDWFNHNEPGGAFFPCSQEEAEKITLTEHHFKYNFPLSAGYSVGSHIDDFILEYSHFK